MKSLTSNFATHTLIGAASLLLAVAADDSYDVSDFVGNDLLSHVVSTKPFFMPAGCTCKVSGATNDEQCDQFDCLCRCDVLAGACDINCCCDPECDSDEIASFSNCLDRGESSTEVRMCTERPPSLEAMNLKYPLRLGDSPEDKLQGLLCTEIDNSAVKGKFFEDQGYPLATQIFSLGGRGANLLGFHSFSREAALVTSKSKYQLGSSIAAYQSSDILTRAFGGYLVLPYPDESGHCIELNTVAFGKSESSRCSKFISDLSAECEWKFSTERYISNIFVEQIKESAVLGTPLSTNNLQPIRIDTFIDSNGTISENLDDIPKKTHWDNSSSICINALKRMAYNVRYNHTKIVSISVVIETLDMEASILELQQEFSVNFIPMEVDPSERSHVKNNLISRIRSGNPGYIVGAPTLGARAPPNVNHTASYVIAQKAGFAIMDTGLAGQCSTSSPTGTTVGFAKNIFVGCTQSFTRDELREFCLDPTNQHPMLSRQKTTMDNMEDFVFPKWLQTNQDMLGIFGNADPMQRNQWIAIEAPTVMAKSRSFIEAERRCIGMPSRLRFEILWTYVGNVDNPQAKILSVRKSFEDGPSLQHTLLSPNEKQPFSFITTVSWTYSPPPKSNIVSSPPPIFIFSVPHDVFYPFQMRQRSTAGNNYEL